MIRSGGVAGMAFSNIDYPEEKDMTPTPAIPDELREAVAEAIVDAGECPAGKSMRHHHADAVLALLHSRSLLRLPDAPYTPEEAEIEAAWCMMTSMAEYAEDITQQVVCEMLIAAAAARGGK